jgi:cyclic dehypoxanthinyl futalosine synthase
VGWGLGFILATLLTYKTIQDAIKEAGFEPQLRNQQYGFRDVPEEIEEQIINY